MLNLFVYLLGFTDISFANNRLKLANNYKVEQTFSGNTLDNTTFHLIIAKNKDTKLFEIIPLVYSYMEGETNRLPSIVFTAAPEILSYHNNNRTLSLVTSSKEKNRKVILVHDLNLESGEVIKSKNYDFKDYKAAIQKPNSSLLLFSSFNSFKIVNVSNAVNFSETIVNQSPENEKVLKILNNEELDAINTDEFVANGSINSLRAYSNNEALYITKESKREKLTSVFVLDISKEGVASFKQKDFKGDKELKKSTSYIFENELIKVDLGKKAGNINVYNLSDSISKNTIDLLNLKPSKKSTGFKDMSSFLKAANKFINVATITANKSENGAVVLRLDYVNKEKYYYHNYWYHYWFHHQMIFRQQQIQQSIRSFGPLEFFPNEDVLFADEEQHYFEVVLSQSREVLNEYSQAIYNDYNKKEHLNELKENKFLDHISTAFIGNRFVYLAYNKKTKDFGISNKTVLYD